MLDRLQFPSTKRPQDLGWALGMFVVTAVVFWPAGQWLATQTFASEQLKQSFVLVVMAGAWIGWEKRRTLRVHLQWSNVILTWLVISYALAAAALFSKSSLLFLAGFVTAVGAIINYVWGAQAFRRTLPLLLVFALLIICVLLFPVLDWPLRQMAGVESAQLLKSMGLAPELVVATQPPVRLLLIVEGRPFLVATECNGFGLITSSLLLGLIRLLYRRTNVGWYLLLLPLCVTVAFVFNFLRISAIVLLAPRFPHSYSTLHEIAGLIALYSGLGVVWLITGWQTRWRKS